MKDLIQFVREESPDLKPKVILMSVAAGLFNGVALAVVMHIANTVADGAFSFQALLLFSTSVGLFAYTKKHALDETAQIAERITKNIRIRLIRKLRETPLIRFERIRPGMIQSALSSDAQTLPQFATVLMNNVSSVVMLVFVMGYLYFLSPTALLILLGSVAICVTYYFMQSGEVETLNSKATETETAFYENLNGLISGFKELKLNRKMSDEFYGDEINQLIDQTAGHRVDSMLATNRLMLLGSVFLFLTMAGILFLLPVVDPDSIASIIPILAVVFFSIGPITDVVVALPIVTRARGAVASIRKLESLIADSYSDIEAWAESRPVHDGTIFKQLEMKHLTFSYQSEQKTNGFALGPIDLTLKQGEVVFLIGGNGSGKSTLIKVLTGLYRPQEGQMHFNNRLITDDFLATYRNQFSCIFSDFHLFDRMIGADDIDLDRFEELVTSMGLSGKVGIHPSGHFNHKNLSSGQRKRLALILSIFDDKPIHIFDEWAADQDPTFRRTFYRDILPNLKAQGKTIFAATHDDHYFDCADRLVKLEYGKMVHLND